MSNKNIIQEVPKVDPKDVKKGKWNIGDISYDEDGDTKFTVTALDKETGAVKWEVKKLPAFDTLFDDATDLVDTAKGVYQKVKNDAVIKQIYVDAKSVRNKIRTHLRNDYPDEYKRMVMKMNEDWDAYTWEIDENTTTGGGSAGFTPGTGMTYATPYAFRRTKKKQKPIPESVEDKYFSLEKGDKLKVNHPEYKNLILTITNPKGSGYEYISKHDGAEAEKGFAPAGYFSSAIERGDAELIKESKDPGATLGPGPKASADGVDDSSYTSEFVYKLVPKNEAGNYVQKGSGLDVKQLFEDQKEFQAERISAFDVIEQEMNDIYKMLSNAKNETSDYYNDNPSSYTVIKPTDLVLDYIKDIKNLLKGE